MEWTLGTLAKILAESGKPGLKATIGDNPLLVFPEPQDEEHLLNTPMGGIEVKTHIDLPHLGAADTGSSDDDPLSEFTQGESVVSSLRKSNRNPFADLITVGRSHSNDIRLAGKQVSKIHCFVLMRDSGWLARDNGSTNGTFVNTTQLEPRVNHPLKPGDELRFANVSSLFVDAEALASLLTSLKKTV